MTISVHGHPFMISDLVTGSSLSLSWGDVFINMSEYRELSSQQILSYPRWTSAHVRYKSNKEAQIDVALSLHNRRTCL